MGLLFVWTLLRRVTGHDVDLAAEFGLGMSVLIGAVVGASLLWIARKRENRVGRREALLLVALSWIVGSALCAVPFFGWAHRRPDFGERHPFESFVNCYFEAISGLTTTGSTILSDIESLPPSLLFWRQLIQWLGGIGIVVLFVAVFPSLGVGGKKLFQFETTGVTRGGVTPTIRATARILLIIYLGLTTLLTLLLWAAGMPPLEALEHSFTTISTAGFSPKNASIAAYDSAMIDIILIVFMVAGGVNFSLYYHLFRRKPQRIWQDRELQVYLGLIVAMIAVITISLHGDIIITTAGKEIHPNWFQSVRYAAFNLTSVNTTTGYVTADFDRWPPIAKSVLAMGMLVGGCAGSTAGGMKISRLVIAVKVLLAMIERTFRPQVVRPVKVHGQALSEELQIQTIGYILAGFTIMGIGTFLTMIFERHHNLDLVGAASANLAAFFTIGPGFHRVGPTLNFEWMTDASKILLCVQMLLGRLELFALLVLFNKRFWLTQ